MSIMHHARPTTQAVRRMKRSRSSLLAITVLLLLACHNGNSGEDRDSSAAHATPGQSTDYKLVSDVDGATIAFTVHEPATMVPGRHYPLLIQSHGFGGAREKAAARGNFSDPLWQSLIDHGYGLISVDERGFGDSGGKVRILNPYYEGQDLLKVLDWAEAELPWLMYRDGNLVLGSAGGSYGGGFQHLIYAIDPKHRLDAMVPEITWHDLRWSLNPNDVFKSFAAALLTAAGNTSTANGGGLDPSVAQLIAEGLAGNRLSETSKALLYQSSLVSYCEGGNAYAIERMGNAPLTKIDAMYWQGAADMLFTLNEEQKNYECLKARGGDIRMLTKNQGHNNAGNGGETCGKLHKQQAYLDWFDEKLKGIRHKATYIPRFCYQLDGSVDDAVVTASLPQPTQHFAVPPQTLVALEASPQQISIPLMRMGAAGAVLIGVPRIHLRISDPTGLQQGDPIVFVSLAKRAPGAVTDTDLFPRQVQPFRGWTDGLDAEMVGLSNRLAANDELRLVIHASYAPSYPKSGSLVATPVTIEATVDVPVLPANLPAPPGNRP